MKFLVVLSAVLLLVKAVPLAEEWQQFKVNYQKTYLSSEEEQKRLAIFRRNLDTIREHNYNYTKGETSFRMHVNKFADLSPEEFKKKILRYKPSKDSIKKINQAASVRFEGEINVDHRKDRCITNVKDQGDCGSCWAFSAVGAMEGQLPGRYGKDKSCQSLSAQYLVDCSTSDGCMGGIMNEAFEWSEKHGIKYEKDYPYKGQDGICLEHKTPTVNVTGYETCPPKNENAMMKMLVDWPLSVAIDATILQLYESGTLKSDCGCSSDPDDMNHGVLLVGADSSSNAYILKNSWGEDWGMQGYCMFEMNKNTCGVSNEASCPHLAL